MKLSSFLNFFEDDVPEADEVKQKEEKINEQYMKRNQLSESIGLSESIIGKYALKLEEHGYVFTKNETGSRIYSKYDEDTFTEMMQLCKEQGYITKEAAMIVANKRKDRESKNTSIQKTFDSLRPMNYYTILRDEMNAMKSDFKKIESILETAKAAIDSNMELVHKLESLEAQNVEKDNELVLLRAKLNSISNLIK
jgi:biotin operon repressor